MGGYKDVLDLRLTYAEETNRGDYRIDKVELPASNGAAIGGVLVTQISSRVYLSDAQNGQYVVPVMQAVPPATARLTDNLPEGLTEAQKAELFHAHGYASFFLGAQQGDNAALEDAIAAYQKAAAAYDAAGKRKNWALTQNNLGTALWALGEREAGTERLEQAVEAYRNALLEYTRETVPLGWAATQNNLALLDLAFFAKTADPTHLDAAETHTSEARTVFVEAGASQYVATADRVLAYIA